MLRRAILVVMATKFETKSAISLFVDVYYEIKCKKLISLQHRVRAMKSHI